jgi:ATP-dependent Lon protease
MRLPPTLLDGPPGIGKTARVISLADLIKVPTMIYDATVKNASFGLVGVQRNWGNSNPGRLLNTILEHRVGNPIVVVDKVKKSGRAESNRDQAYSLTDALLPVLEPLGAASWYCPYFEVRFDMSDVIWVMTSNNARILPEPLLSRCPPMRLQGMTTAEGVGFVGREEQRKALDDVSIKAIVEAIEHHDQFNLSLRTVVRIIGKAAQFQAIGVRLH